MSDLISRQAAIDAITSILGDVSARHNGWIDPYYAVQKIKTLTSVQHEGRWIHQNGDLYECGECGAMEHISPEWGYCPVCGAEMEGREE